MNIVCLLIEYGRSRSILVSGLITWFLTLQSRAHWTSPSTVNSASLLFAKKLSHVIKLFTLVIIQNSLEWNFNVRKLHGRVENFKTLLSYHCWLMDVGWTRRPRQRHRDDHGLIGDTSTSCAVHPSNLYPMSEASFWITCVKTGEYSTSVTLSMIIITWDYRSPFFHEHQIIVDEIFVPLRCINDLEHWNMGEIKPSPRWCSLSYTTAYMELRVTCIWITCLKVAFIFRVIFLSAFPQISSVSNCEIRFDRIGCKQLYRRLVRKYSALELMGADDL